jgi:hypothetical protein
VTPEYEIQTGQQNEQKRSLEEQTHVDDRY